MDPKTMRKNRIEELRLYADSIDGDPGLIRDMLVVESQRRFLVSTFTAKDYAKTVLRLMGLADGWLTKVPSKEAKKDVE